MSGIRAVTQRPGVSFCYFPHPRTQLIRIKSCEFLFQVEAPRGNGGIPSEQGLNVERPFESRVALKTQSTFQCYPVTPPRLLSWLQQEQRSELNRGTGNAPLLVRLK
jgi:hypothetical protein